MVSILLGRSYQLVVYGQVVNKTSHLKAAAFSVILSAFLKLSVHWKHSFRVSLPLATCMNCHQTHG